MDGEFQWRKLTEIIDLPYSSEESELSKKVHGLEVPMVARIGAGSSRLPKHLQIEENQNGLIATIELPVHCESKKPITGT
ncbi:hypothetical protein AAHB49_08160 [Bacillus cereus]